MRTLETGHFRFHFNSDLSGQVEIQRRSTGESISVPGHELVAFVASWVRDSRMAIVEGMTTAELLGVDEVP